MIDILAKSQEKEFLGSDGHKVTAIAALENRGLIGLVIRLTGGKIQSERGAQKMLIGFVILVLFFSLILLFAGGEEYGVADIRPYPVAESGVLETDWPPLRP